LLEQQALDYRNRAELLRTAVVGTRRPVAQRLLQDLADEADAMAAKIEERLKLL
jgi:hypothetical protein